MNYYILIDSNNIITSTTQTESTLASPWIAITAAELSTARQMGSTWDDSTSTVNAPPSNYNLVAVGNAQIGVIKSAAASAMVAPLAYTLASGVATSFPMDGVSQNYYHGAFTTYVLGAETLPTDFTLRDVNGAPQAATVADIKGIFVGGVAQIQGANAKMDTLISQIQGYVSGGGTVSEIQAVTF